MSIKINEDIIHLNDRIQWEFKCIEKFLVGKGLDVGCGTNRLSQDILSLDNYDYKNSVCHNDSQRANGNDLTHDCKDLEGIAKFEWKGRPYNFSDNEFDFIFSSHCLEDFEDIEKVFHNWWKKIKPGGLMLLLLPDMELCQCSLCQGDEEKKRRKAEKRSARYWTIEDYKKMVRETPPIGKT